MPKATAKMERAENIEKFEAVKTIDTVSLKKDLPTVDCQSVIIKLEVNPIIFSSDEKFQTLISVEQVVADNHRGLNNIIVPNTPMYVSPTKTKYDVTKISEVTESDEPIRQNN